MPHPRCPGSAGVPPRFCPIVMEPNLSSEPISSSSNKAMRVDPTKGSFRFIGTSFPDDTEKEPLGGQTWRPSCCIGLARPDCCRLERNLPGGFAFNSPTGVPRLSHGALQQSAKGISSFRRHPSDSNHFFLRTTYGSRVLPAAVQAPIKPKGGRDVPEV